MTVPEVWRPIPGYEGLYDVSSSGRVRSHYHGGRILRPYTNNVGYLLVTLSLGGVKRTWRVHRLVLLAFVGPGAEGEETLHIDGDPGNNVLSNLRWGTRSENTLDKVRHGTHINAIKTHCPRGHLLAEPNLVPSLLRRGSRSCLACARAHANVKTRGGDLQTVSDAHYQAIMGSDLGV